MAFDISKFKSNTDYPRDLVIYIKQGSFSIGNGQTIGSLGFEDINGVIDTHGLPFTVLPEMMWSNTADFDITTAGSDEAAIDAYFATPAGQIYNVFSNGNDISIEGVNNSGSTKTVYYRIWGFAPSNVSDESLVPFTVSLADVFAFNSDFNYLKLVDKDYLTPTAGIVTKDHNLGYIPRVKVWTVSVSGGDVVSAFGGSDILCQVISNDLNGTGGTTVGFYPTTTQLVMMNNNGYGRIEYRVYADA